jgi:hypothetical protein
MSKTYTLLLNSANAVNRTGSGVANYTYYVKWNTLLPFNVKRYDVSFSLKSTLTSTIQSAPILVSANIGTQTTYDQSSTQCPIIGAVIPKSNPGTTVYFFYESMITDQSGFMINHPGENNFLNIRLLNSIPDANGIYSDTLAFPTSYILQLSFTEILE